MGLNLGKERAWCSRDSLAPYFLFSGALRWPFLIGYLPEECQYRRINIDHGIAGEQTILMSIESIKSSYCCK